MSDIKFLKFEAVNAGTKEVLIQNVPEGLSLQRNHIRPVYQRRTQAGDLVAQSVYYHKKNFAMNGGVFDRVLSDYFKILYETRENAVITVYDYDDSFSLIVEYTATVKLTRFQDLTDFVDSNRSWNVEFEEI